LTKNLIDKKDKNLNELELFYLEYIPKCTLVIKNIINKMKELMEMYSIKNIINLLIGNINIEMNTKNYINEIDNINDILLSTFNNNLAKLINDFKYLQNQNQNKDKYLYKYKEKMLIITTIIYNICNEPQKIEKIICNYNKIIQKLIKHKIKTSEEIFNEENNNIQIKDCFDYNLDKFGFDHYLLFDNNKLINDNIKKVYGNIDPAIDLIKKFLKENPADRWGDKNLDEIKKHKFFEGFNWKDIQNIKNDTIKDYVKRRVKESNNKIKELNIKNKEKKETLNNNYEDGYPSVIEINLTENEERNFFTERLDNLNKKNNEIMKKKITKESNIKGNLSNLMILDLE
jgi:hypothetical protein